MTRERTSERGAVLIHVAVCLLALIAFNAFIIDQGIMLTSRRQAQNSADAGALAGALALAYDDPSDFASARVKARAAALRNPVWDAPPDITLADVLVPIDCPPGAPPGKCLRVNVYRNQRPGGSPLPVFFARLLGISEQGVRATATARILYGDTSDCVKPFAIPDKWDERRPVTTEWDENATFERYQSTGPNKGELLDPADVYAPSIEGSPGTGFTVENDYGRRLVLKAGHPSQAIAPGWFFPVVLDPEQGPGADNYRTNIATCNGTDIGPGTVLQNEPGNMVGPTRQGMDELIARDPFAEWDASANGGLGAPSGGCMASGACGISPRLVALAVFNPDAYDEGRASGRLELVVTNLIGFWIERMQGNDVVGYITHYPQVAAGDVTVDDESAFLRTVILVR